MNVRDYVNRRRFVGAAAVTMTALSGGRAFGRDAGGSSGVPFDRFLTDLPGPESTRRGWYLRYQKAEAYARQCLGKWEMGKLEVVALSPDKTMWSPDGTLNVTKESLADGALYHELFHPILHNSPFRLKADRFRIKYGLYIECLCNAFEYFMEVQIGPRGNWIARMAKWRSKSWAQILAMSTDLDYDMTYGLPALEFIRSCRDFTAFKAMLVDLNSK
jgi:hypothetical protein